MSWLSILSGLARAIGLFQLAEKLWQRHKLQEAQNVNNKVGSMSDATVSDELSKFNRD